MADIPYIQQAQEVKITGQDSTGNTVNYVTADSSGNLGVKNTSAGPVTPGAAAVNSTLVGAQFNTALPTLTNNQQSSLQLDSSGKLLANISGSAAGTPDKTSFTYGTTDQLTIGGVYQDTSPALTAGQEGALRLNQNRAIHSTLRDPTTDTGVTTASNGNAGNQLLHAQTPDTTTASTTLGSLAANAIIAMAGLQSVGFQLNSGTLIGTLVPELSIDGGNTWLSTNFYDLAGNDLVPSLVFASSNTLKILSIVLLGGTSHVRVRVSAYTSGTTTSLLRASNATGGGVSSTLGGSSAAFNTVINTFVTPVNNTATLLLAANPARKYAAISNGSGSQLNIQLGTTTGLSTSTGFVVVAKAAYEFKGENLWTGNIYGFMAGGASISVIEGTL